MKEFHKDFSELAVFPSIDHDVDTGVEDKEEIREVGQDSTPRNINIKVLIYMRNTFRGITCQPLVNFVQDIIVVMSGYT